MPYLQLDVPGTYPANIKRALANELGSIYAEVMKTQAEKVVVAIRELGEGSMWRCGDSCAPAAMLSCDIRLGRPAELRAQLAERLIEASASLLNLMKDQLTVEFTQHPGDDFYRPGCGLVSDWSPAEAS
jgi:phenylpyruvate tautomerase PptA (4-oxalocrotonate tautomerase family)